MRTKLFTLAALLLTPLAAICGGAEATLPAKPDASSKKTQNFLFIGNSFTMARDILRANYYSRRTEEVYLGWMRRFILFHGKQHPRDLWEPAVAKFLSHLTVQQDVSASTQNQAFSALLFFYAKVIGRPKADPVGWFI